MDFQEALPYLTRTNHNGTFDAVCGRCFETCAAHVAVESELEWWHGKHACDGACNTPSMFPVLRPFLVSRV